MTESPRPFDAGDADSVKRHRKAARSQEISREAIMAGMLSTPEARALIWNYLSALGLFASVFHAESGAMYFAEGQRNAGLRLYAEIPDDLKILMAKEHKESENAKVA